MAIRHVASANRIELGGDTNIYRSAANVLKTDDAFETASSLTAAGAVNINMPAAGAPFVLNAFAQGQLVTGLNADQLDSQTGAHYLDYANFTNPPSIDVLTDVDITTVAPAAGQILEWNGTKFVPATPGSGTLAGHSDTDILAPAAGHVLIYDGLNTWDNKAVSGDITISTAGVTAIASGVVVNADVSASAAISHSKLANATAGQVLLGTTTTGVVTATTVSGDVTISGAGVTAIGAGVIVDADINASAAITWTKINKSGSSVGDLGDVTSTTPTAGQFLVHNGTTAYANVSMSGGATMTSAGVVSLNIAPIVNADISASAAIAFSKLAALTSGNILVGSLTNVATSVAMSGDVTLSNAGVASLAATLAGNKTFSNDVTISGNLTVTGTTTTVSSATLAVTDNIITVNVGEVGIGVTAGTAGIEVERGTLVNYQFLFDEASDTFRAGEAGSLQAVATREDAPISTALAFWNDTAKRFDTAAGMTWDGSTLAVAGLSTANFALTGDLSLGSANCVNFGSPTTNGTWRLCVVASEVVLQLREVGVFNTKHQFAA